MIDPRTYKLNFEFTIEEINIILSGLQELPAKVCNPLTQAIQKQAGPQLPKQEADDPQDIKYQ